MATTTNYGWTTPDDTALVKDGASAIRTLGSSIDTTTKNLNPETTLGDISYRSSTANVKTRLALGTANQQLRVNAGATAPEWFTPAAGGAYTSLASGSLPTGASTLTISSISGSYQELKLILRDYSVTLNNFFINFRLNSDTGSNYGHCNYFTTAVDTVSFAADSVDDKITHPNSLRVGDNFLMLSIQDYANSSSFKTPTLLGMARANGDTFDCFLNATAYYKSTTAITSIDVFTGAQNFSGGTYELFGVK